MSRRLIAVLLYALPPGWRDSSRAQYRSSPSGLVTTTSGQLARPCTRTCGGASRPLPVGSLKSRDTRGSRRMLSALVGRATDVVRVNVPSAGSYSGQVGQEMAVPERVTVANSQVR